MRLNNLFLTAALAASRTAASSNVTVYRNESFVPGDKLPASHATSDGSDIMNLFFGLSRSTTWKLISKTKLEGNTGEPEGMVRVATTVFLFHLDSGLFQLKSTTKPSMALIARQALDLRI
jgi:hypothetical protein